jgi:hypothetical protein
MLHKILRATLCLVGTAAFAQTTITRQTEFPPVGLAATETAQINVINTASNSQSTPASCSGTFAFANTSGATIGTAANFTVTSGQIASFALPFLKTGAIGTRTELIGKVTLTRASNSAAPCSLVISYETYDTSSGVTHVYLSSSLSLPVISFPH